MIDTGQPWIHLAFLQLIQRCASSGYNLPKNILNPIGIAALNVNVSINNVCTFSNVKNAMNFDGTDTNADIISCYPTARSYMLGLNLTF